MRKISFELLFLFFLSLTEVENPLRVFRRVHSAAARISAQLDSRQSESRYTYHRRRYLCTVSFQRSAGIEIKNHMRKWGKTGGINSNLFTRQGWRNLSPANVMETPIEKEISPVQIRLYAVVSPELDCLRVFPFPRASYLTAGLEQVKLKKRAAYMDLYIS